MVLIAHIYRERKGMNLDDSTFINQQKPAPPQRLHCVLMQAACAVNENTSLKRAPQALQSLIKEERCCRFVAFLVRRAQAFQERSWVCS